MDGWIWPIGSTQESWSDCCRLDYVLAELRHHVWGRVNGWEPSWIDWLLWININLDWLIDVTPWGRENLFPSGVEKDLDRCDRRYLRPKNVRVAEKLWYSDTEAGPTSILRKSWFTFAIAEWRLISRIHWSADYWSLNDSVIEWAENADRDENI